MEKDNIVDISTATPDQAFMLMLCERVEKLEEEWTATKKAWIAAAARGPTVAPCAKELYDKLANLYSSHKQKQQLDDMRNASELVPKNILEKIPSNSIKELLDAVSGDVKKQSYTAYYAMSFLERHQNIDDEFVEWYAKALGL